MCTSCMRCREYYPSFRHISLWDALRERPAVLIKVPIPIHIIICTLYTRILYFITVIYISDRSPRYIRLSNRALL